MLPQRPEFFETPNVRLSPNNSNMNLNYEFNLIQVLNLKAANKLIFGNARPFWSHLQGRPPTGSIFY